MGEASAVEAANVRSTIGVVLVSVAALCAPGTWASPPTASPEVSKADFEDFAKALDRLAADIPLPGYAAVIVSDGAIVWRHGYGNADRENEVPCTPDTPFRLASLSKPLAAAPLMQLVEEKKLSLDDAMKKFKIYPWFEPGGGSWAHYPSRYMEKSITVRHVLTHTSQNDPPGDGYRYSGNIFGDLTFVIEDVTRQSYPVILRERILEKAGMTRSLAGQLVPGNPKTARALAKPYKLVDGELAPGTYPGFGLQPDRDVTAWNLDPAYRIPAATDAARRALLADAYTPLDSSKTAAGVISTVLDLARFDMALDRDKLVSSESREAMFTASRTSDGRVLPYGLGWFVEEPDGLKIVWHYGWHPPTVSALYIKIPARKLTFIMLANSDGISANVPWAASGVRGSDIARLFLEQFVPSP